MFILGVNCVYHESSACLLKDGQLIAFAEEERFNRIKHGKKALPSNPDELPLAAIKFCCEKGSISTSDIDHIAYSFDPVRRSKVKWPDEGCEAAEWGSREAEKIFLKSLSNIPVKLKGLGCRAVLHWIGHQISHGASAYYYSPYMDSAVLSLDGIGEEDSTSLMYGEDNSLITLENVSYPNSIGFMWEKFCKFLGFSEYHSCKLMGLAAYGDLHVYNNQFNELVALKDDGTFEMDNSLLNFRRDEMLPLEKMFGFKKRERDEPIEIKHQHLAAALQEKTNQIVMHLANRLYKLCGKERLCLAGGVALNCVSNSYVKECGPFKEIFIQPSANDAGTSFGAAGYVWHHILGNKKRDAISNHVYYGPSFSDDSYCSVLRSENLNYTYHENIEEVVAQLVSEGNIVGFFQDAMEFGPRALGNRSLIADPRNPNIREVLNLKVKHRELFRPFAPSILEEFASEWFEIPGESLPHYFMLMVNRVKCEKESMIPAVVHIDGTARIQKVSKTSNPKYHKLIKYFYDITGVPLILNTSFNDDEPIVCTPRDAVNTFGKTLIDYLVLGKYLVDRKEQSLAVLAGIKSRLGEGE